MPHHVEPAVGLPGGPRELEGRPAVGEAESWCCADEVPRAAKVRGCS